jgi:hypothetical protein
VEDHIQSESDAPPPSHDDYPPPSPIDDEWFGATIRRGLEAYEKRREEARRVVEGAHQNNDA